MNSGAYILNDNLEPVDGSGTVGQLFVSSPNLAMGYCGVKAEGKSFIRAEVNNNILIVYPLSFLSLNISKQVPFLTNITMLSFFRIFANP